VRYQRIVVPLDGSELAERALDHAEPLAVALTVPMHLVRVVDTSALSLIGPGLAAEQYSFAVMLEAIAAEEKAAGEYLEAVTQRLEARGLRAIGEIRSGRIVDEILAAARPGDLLALTTHGRTGLARWFFGSVAEGVVRRAAVPVLLVRSKTGPDGSEKHDK
jgi:nucleotide-binding universal stress UspA family protein